jgi:hypothetical protein
MIRFVWCLVVAISLAGCSFPSNWGDRVPTINPEAEANRPIVGAGPDSVTLNPISERGAVVGRAYQYDMPHCGLMSPIDVDGSFWVAARVPADPVVFDGQPGTFTLVDRSHATFRTSDGIHSVPLLRFDGPQAFRMCG